MTWIMLYFGAQNHSVIGPLRPIINTQLTCRPRLKIFEKMPKVRHSFYLFWAPSDPKSWTPEAHILHTSKSTCNEHVKQYWCETSENCLKKMTKVWILIYLGGPKWPENWASEAHMSRTPESTCIEHVKQYWCEISENILRKWPKFRILIFFVVQIGPKIGPTYFTSLKVAPMNI